MYVFNLDCFGIANNLRGSTDWEVITSRSSYNRGYFLLFILCTINSFYFAVFRIRIRFISASWIRIRVAKKSAKIMEKMVGYRAGSGSETLLFCELGAFDTVSFVGFPRSAPPWVYRRWLSTKPKTRRPERRRGSGKLVYDKWTFIQIHWLLQLGVELKVYTKSFFLKFY